ncbi:MAG TPA: hypothetical protein VJZ26_19050 [Blastocatellia bacterium]|nr:hypothetical protein [Blastocatellia bacterium]
MKSGKWIILIAVAVVALSHVSDGQQSRPVAEQLRLASVCPRGALVYVQSRDLAAMMKAWVASTVRDKFYKSASFEAFAKSRIWLKMLERKKDLEGAIGVGIDEGRLAEIAGGASAISIYDIGKLEVVFVTEVPRERAVATALFKQAPQFQERNASGSAYYVRDVTTDGGRLNQQFCFAHANGKLIVTTTEGLMIRALGNAKSASADSLMADVMATAEQSKGFAAHEVTMWLDQARLNRNRHFNSYWIHRNVSDPSSLASIESGLLDLRITPQAMTEQRWFVMGATSPKNAASLTGDQAGALLRFAPADAHLAEVHAASDGLTAAVSDALLGKLPGEAPERPEAPDRTHSSANEEAATRTERYSRLDARFDVDVDDEQAPDRRSGGGGQQPAKANSASPAPAQATALAQMLEKVSPAGYCELVRSKADAGKPFVHFERAVVIEMKSEAAIDRAALERAITDEMRARFVVAGVDPRLVWQDESQVRYLAQSLLEQGAAYSVSGKYLVLASSREFARDIAQAAATAPAEASKVDGAVQYYALVRVADAKPIFDKLVSKLDGKTQQPAAEKKNEDDQSEETEKEIKFFSDNLSGLISATTIREVRVHRQMSATTMVERVVYSW